MPAPAMSASSGLDAHGGVGFSGGGLVAGGADAVLLIGHGDDGLAGRGDDVAAGTGLVLELEADGAFEDDPRFDAAGLFVGVEVALGGPGLAADEPRPYLGH